MSLFRRRYKFTVLFVCPFCKHMWTQQTDESPDQVDAPCPKCREHVWAPRKFSWND